MLDDLAWFPLTAPCMRCHRGPSNHPCGPYSRYRRTHYRGSARFLKRPGAPINRGTSRQYIIYQQNAEVVNLQALVGGVGATYRFRAFAAGSHRLRRARPAAGQQIALELQSETPRQRPRDQFGLVMTPLALAVAAERRRDDHVRAPLLRLTLDQFRLPRCEPVAQAREFVILQQQDASMHPKRPRHFPQSVPRRWPAPGRRSGTGGKTRPTRVRQARLSTSWVISGCDVNAVVSGHTTPRGVAANIHKTADARDLQRLAYSRPFSFFSWQVMQ
jgi:hypothetical protein